MKNKVLIIPSWYPTPQKQLNGSFFKEQAEFLHSEAVAEIKVLYGDERSTTFFKLLWIYVLSLVKSKWPIHQNLVEQGPDAYGFIIPKNRRIPEKYRVKLARRLYKMAYRTFENNNWKPNLIHAQSGMDAGIYAHDISKSKGIPFVIIEHQVFLFHYYSRRRAKLVLDSFKAALKVGAVSQDQRRQILINQPKCIPVLIPNLVNEEAYSLKFSRERGGDSKFKIVTVMYANPVKGFETFFETMSFLKSKSLNFEFTVIGNGYFYGKNVFEELMVKFGLDLYGKIVLKVERDVVYSYLIKADVYVCSSDYETFGMAPREAMMCGLPIVTTSNGGVEDCISKEVGLVVPIRDSRALANAILKIAHNYNSFNSKTIIELGKSQFGKDIFSKKMTQFYAPK